VTWVVAAVVALLIGVSRLYLGVHWLSDVIGGFALAAAWLATTLTAVTASRRWRLPAKPVRRPDAGRG
jgi:undecaprenyl-diphosphatase